MLFTTDDFDFSRIPAPLILWYQANKRSLQWRENADPYRVWVSEIMLQQTRVEAVKEYYARFLKALPTVYALADCSEEELLKLWEGLGYYSRVRNMQKTAKVIVEKYGGKFPQTKAELLKLHGIGEYTAGAIASIALYKREPAVDGNVFRVISRLTQNPTDISEPKYRGYLTEKLREVYPPEGVLCSDFTQALMELGAMVCKPQTPECSVCPLSEICLSKANETQEKFPVLPQKKAKRREQVCVLLIQTPNGIAIRKRKDGVLKGMYEFPSFIGLTVEQALKELQISSYKLIKQSKATHIFTHIVWDMEISLVQTEKTDLQTYSLEELKEKISLPRAFRQCLKVFDEEV
jgi:A/G-specific adenine glycosylase